MIRLLLCLLLMTVVPSGADSDSRPLPSYPRQSFEDDVRISHGVVVAKLLHAGTRLPAYPMASVYVAKWKILKALRGNYPDQSEFSFFIDYASATEAKQRLPAVGQTYILIIYWADSQQTNYILDYTQESLQRVKNLLHQR